MSAADTASQMQTQLRVTVSEGATILLEWIGEAVKSEAGALYVEVTDQEEQTYTSTNRTFSTLVSSMFVKPARWRRTRNAEIADTVEKLRSVVKNSNLLRSADHRSLPDREVYSVMLHILSGDAEKDRELRTLKESLYRLYRR